MIKICELHDGAISLHAVHVMLKVAQHHKLGEYVRVYAMDTDGNSAEYWHQGDMRRPVTSFPEWGIEFEKGILCSRRADAPPLDKEPGAIVVTKFGTVGYKGGQYFGKEGAIREGWGRPTILHAIGYMEGTYGSDEAAAITALKGALAQIAPPVPGRPAPW